VGKDLMSQKGRRSHNNNNLEQERNNNNNNLQISNEYTDEHRILLQYIISKKVVLESELEKKTSLKELENAISFINLQLQSLMIEIKKITFEEDGKVYWGLVNISDDEFSQLASSFLPSQIELFKKIVTIFNLRK
jgi:hypothetical protein